MRICQTNLEIDIFDKKGIAAFANAAGDRSSYKKHFVFFYTKIILSEFRRLWVKEE